MANMTMQNPLGEKPVGRLLIQYAIPSIVSTLLSSLYNIVDQIFIGQRIGYLGNAATTVAYPLTILSYLIHFKTAKFRRSHFTVNISAAVCSFILVSNIFKTELSRIP